MKLPNADRPRVEIHYCTGCRWLLRSAWLAQELLTTFEQDLGEVALIPADTAVFLIRVVCPGNPNAAESSDGPPTSAVDTTTVWDRAVDGGFPEAKILKQRVRDQIAPHRPLGHSDVSDVSDASDA